MTEALELLKEVHRLTDEIDAENRTEQAKLRRKLLAQVKALRKLLRECREAEAAGRETVPSRLGRGAVASCPKTGTRGNRAACGKARK